MSEEKMLPCPFCGEAEQRWLHVVCDGGISYVQCNCSAAGAGAETEAAAISAWNKRHVEGGEAKPVAEVCEYCSDGKRTGLPGNACENCMNTGLKYPEQPEDGSYNVKAIAMVISLSYGEDPLEDAPLSKICGPNNEPLPCWMAYEEQGKAVFTWMQSVIRALLSSDTGGGGDTGSAEADRIIDRLMSSDPDFNDCTDAATLIRRLVVEHKGPDGFPTWKDAAIAERLKVQESRALGWQEAVEAAAKVAKTSRDHWEGVFKEWQTPKDDLSAHYVRQGAKARMECAGDLEAAIRALPSPHARSGK